MASDAKNVTNASTSPMSRTAAASTAALARASRTRPGAAASVARIMPEEYSLVTASTPIAAAASWASARPVNPLLTGSKIRWSARLIWPQRATARCSTSMPRPIVITAVASAVHRTDRRLRSLIHSIRAIPRNR